MIKYYPLNRVVPNQHTRGDEYTLNGQVYTGPYYTTYTGEAFTGTDPINGPSNKLSPAITVPPTNYKPANSNVPTSNLIPVTYDATNGDLQQFKTPQPYYVKPTADDYKRRSIMRYFAKKRGRPGFIIEVDKATHDSLKNTDSEYDYTNYESISTLWQLTGPLHDDRTNKQYAIAGIIDTNKRLIEAKDPSFPGLLDFIGGDYTKFAIPTTK